jgi:hypothetical protein
MDVWQILKEYAQQHPQAAAILMGAVACFAAVAAVRSFGIDLEASIPSVLYIIGIGVLLLIVVAVLNDAMLMTFIKWFIVMLGLVWLAVFIAHKIIDPGSPKLACAAFFWQPCRATADSIAPPPSLPPPQQVVIPRIENAGSYQVFVQFAGLINRDDVRMMMRQLSDSGWRVEGVEGGGERTAKAAGFAEVRYAERGDEPVAKALAEAIQATKLLSKPLKATENPRIKKGTLEVWISR